MRTPLDGQTPLRSLRIEWERTMAWVLVAIALVVVALGHHWLEASSSRPEKVAYLISSGCTAVLLVIVAVGLLVTADLDDQIRKLTRIAAGRGGQARADAGAVLAALRTGQGAALFDRELSAVKSGPTRPPRALGRPERMIASLLLAVTAVIIAGGWMRAATTGKLGVALGGLGVGFAGLLFATGVVVSVTFRCRRTVTRYRSEVLDGLLRPGSDGHEDRLPRHAGARDDGYWAATGLKRYHRLSCAALTTAPSGDRRRVASGEPGLEPCLLCQPEAE